MAVKRVEAAGGVVIRDLEGEREVALVHRPRYDDWSHPKGKLERGESFEKGALREVEEETGLICELGAELASTRYSDRKGRPKIVRYWLMTPRRGEFKPNEEVDELRWVSLAEAVELLDYDHDCDLVEEVRGR